MRSIAVFSCLILTACATFADNNQVNPRDAAPTTQEAVRDRVRLVATLERSPVSIGSPVNLKIAIENVSENDVVFWMAAPDSQFLVDIYDPNGDPVPWTRYGEHRQDRRVPQIWQRTISIQVKKDEAMQYTLQLDRLYDLTLEGRYSLRVKFAFSPLRALLADEGDNDNTVISNLVILDMKLPNMLEPVRISNAAITTQPSTPDSQSN